jgi:hypothetical protein
VAILTGLFQDAHHGRIDIGAGEQRPCRICLQSKRMDEGRRDGKHAGARNGVVRTLEEDLLRILPAPAIYSRVQFTLEKPAERE